MSSEDEGYPGHTQRLDDDQRRQPRDTFASQDFIDLHSREHAGLYTGLSANNGYNENGFQDRDQEHRQGFVSEDRYVEMVQRCNSLTLQVEQLQHDYDDVVQQLSKVTKCLSFQQKMLIYTCSSHGGRSLTVFLSTFRGKIRTFDTSVTSLR